ncbi:MAG: carboxylating nicotinate-nucleotide diphosphorylase [Ignavibacteria bacterium]|nr:carboxylating nicotinate-nucleotide diphosphorylase [Ignavibacteria bacterium]
MAFLPYRQIENLDPEFVQQKLAYFISEDVPDTDKTSEIFFSTTKKSKAFLENEEEIVFAGKQILEQIPSLCPEPIMLKIHCNDGEKIPSNTKIFEITGQTKFLLKIERTIINLLQRLCGIATTTRKYVEIANKYNVRILDTRKTTPGLRIFEKYAVRCGGGWNHRLNLSEGILIKDNHIFASGSLSKAIEMARAIYPLEFVEVEVENYSQLLEALLLNVDGILLDNFSSQDVREAVAFARSKKPDIFIEASGGITLNNLEEYAKTGVDAISIGALTHSAKSVKMHLEFFE